MEVTKEPSLSRLTLRRGLPLVNYTVRPTPRRSVVLTSHILSLQVCQIRSPTTSLGV